jgi:hypothetical protein
MRSRARLFLQVSAAGCIGVAAGLGLAAAGAPMPDVKTVVSALRLDCHIKGNVSYDRGRLIYHVPGQLDYDGTSIDASRGERWFCSEEEAQGAGWRRATR